MSDFTGIFDNFDKQMEKIWSKVTHKTQGDDEYVIELDRMQF